MGKCVYVYMHVDTSYIHMYIRPTQQDTCTHYACTCMNKKTEQYIGTYKYTCIHIHTYIRMCMDIQTHRLGNQSSVVILIHIHVHIQTHMHMHMHINIHMHTHMHINIHIHIHIYTYTYTHTHTQT